MATYDKEMDYDQSATYFKLKERHIYGSSRVGVRNSGIDLLPLPTQNYSMKSVHYSIGSRTYELSNQLPSVLPSAVGNVLSVISDTAKGSHAVNVIPQFSSSTVISEMRADIRVAQDYSPFTSLLSVRTLRLVGVTLDGRNFVVSEGYRYGYQGSEKDNEIKGEGNSYTTEFRQLDPRLGRWLSIDPKASSMPWQSPYCSMDNNPIWFNDVLGDSTKFKIIETGEEHELLDGSDATVEISQTDFKDLKFLYDNDECELYDKHLDRLGLGTKGYELALEARKQLGSTDWAYDVSNPPFAANQNKCNQFVWDMCKEVDPNSLSNYTAGSPPRAGDAWGSPTKKINGTEIVNATTDNIKLGDIVGGKTIYRDASGHVEIVTGIDPFSGKITSTGAGSTKVRTSTFIQSVLEGKMWSKHIYSPFAVRRLK